jgi:nucleotide-binding universal stress UspA family protein
VSSKIVVGLDGSASGERAVAYAKKMANLIGACELVLAHVIEWSPYTFQTPEENEMRHKRREEELAQATSRIIDPAVAAFKKEGFTARGVVRHGDVADLLNKVAEAEGADQIIVARASEAGLVQRIFGSSTVSLVTPACVPVTVVA